jgi:hypothetical protein
MKSESPMVTLSLLLGSTLWRQYENCGKDFSAGPKIREVQGRFRAGSGPVQEMLPQNTRVLNRIDGLPIACLKGADTNNNGLETESGFR